MKTPSRTLQKVFFYQVVAMTNEKVKAKLIDERGLERTITRLAHEILERNKGIESIAIVGVRTRGAPIAERIVQKISEIEGKETSVTTMLAQLVKLHQIVCGSVIVNDGEIKEIPNNRIGELLIV